AGAECARGAGWGGELMSGGSPGRALPVTRDINALPMQYLSTSPIRDTAQETYLSAQVPNPFQNLLPGSTINGATVPRSQLLRPFPLFGGITETQLNTGRVWYNSLQVSAQKRYSHGLTFSANYTFSKNIEALSYLNSQDVA